MHQSLQEIQPQQVLVGGNLMVAFQAASSSAGSPQPGSPLPLHPSLQCEILPSEGMYICKDKRYR